MGGVNLRAEQAGNKKLPIFVKAVSRQRIGLYIALHQANDKKVMKDIKKTSRRLKSIRAGFPARMDLFLYYVACRFPAYLTDYF
jgi:hypothetical protein